ncbi:MAG: alpha/beta hydrolase [Verrucomicrobiota bacterium]
MSPGALFKKVSLPSCSALLIACLIGTGVSAQEKTKADTKPAPDIANLAYGPHNHNVLDLWKAKSDTPTPLVVFIHGGGFSSGNKEELRLAMLTNLLAKGISVMAINYRLTPETFFPGHYLDCARAIQFARLHAKEWNLDPQRIGATGVSAGTGTSLWIAFHDDLADPANTDPVLRQSTQLACVAVHGAQSTYDPRNVREWVGEAAAQHPALRSMYGLKPEEVDTPKAYQLYDAAAPLTYLTKKAPPVYAFYNEPRGPLPAYARPGTGIHHINFGLKLKEQMDKLGVECIVRHLDEGAKPEQESLEFFVRHLLKEPVPATTANKR